MNILIVEDQKHQFEFVKDALLAEEDSLIIKQIITEYSFVSQFEKIADNPPCMIFMDIMFRWYDSEKNMPEIPLEAKKQGKYRAGIRCINKLSSDIRTKNIPVLIYSILDKRDLQNEINKFPQVKYLVKDFTEEKIASFFHSIKK
jgi:CheY-like chemotaxis protein